MKQAVVLLAVVCCALAASKCTTDALRVRSKPSTSGATLRTLAKGASVNVISTANGWSKIGNGQYVSAQYLKACTTAPRPSPARPTPARPAPSTGGATLTQQQLQRIMPGLSSSKAAQYISHLSNGMREAGITTCPRKAAFLAQLAHESGQLRYFEEIASGAAYEGRRDLGNTQPGDGRRFKGRGPIQLTGRSNYAAAGRVITIFYTKFLGIGIKFDCQPTTSCHRKRRLPYITLVLEFPRTFKVCRFQLAIFVRSNH